MRERSSRYPSDARVTDFDERNTYTPPHSHEFYEFTFVHSGQILQSFEDGGPELALGRRDALLICPGGVHASRQIEQCTCTNLFLRPDWLLSELQILWAEAGLAQFLLADALLGGISPTRVVQLTLTEEEFRIYEDEHGSMRRESERDRPSVVYYTGVFLKILRILDLAFSRTYPEGVAPVPVWLWSVIESIEQCVQQGKTPDLAAVAKGAGCSVSKLTHEFPKVVGVSPHQYYIRRRMQAAAQMLLCGDLPVTEVAYRFGFCDAAYFTRSFKAEFGVTPTTYRKRHRAPEARTTARTF